MRIMKIAQPVDEEMSSWRPDPQPQDNVSRVEENFGKEEITEIETLVKYIRKTSTKFSFFGSNPQREIERILSEYEIYAYALNGSFFGLGFFKNGSFREGLVSEPKKDYFAREYGLQPMAGSSDSAWMDIHNKAH